MSKPTEWQQDAKNIKTARVQSWYNGIMVTAQLARKQARAMVEEKIAYVISEQAIGFLDRHGERKG